MVFGNSILEMYSDGVSYYRHTRLVQALYVSSILITIFMWFYFVPLTSVSWPLQTGNVYGSCIPQ